MNATLELANTAGFMRFKLTFTGVIDPTGGDPECAGASLTSRELEFGLRQVLQRGLSEGTITGESPATLDDYSYRVEIHPSRGDDDAGAWPTAYSDAAIAEGWDLFETDGCESEPWRNDVLSISCLNDSDGTFGSDEDALLHVIEQAKTGSAIHRRALELHMSLRDA